MIEFGRYIEALNNLCGVDYSYMRGDEDVEAILSLIDLAYTQSVKICVMGLEIETLKNRLSEYEGDNDG